MDRIALEVADRIATITINNPEKLNCLDTEMLLQMEDYLQSIKKGNEVRVLVIEGAGEKAFSTGGNLKKFGALEEFHDVKEWIKTGNEVFNILDDLPISTIASIRGFIMGGGLELALACDLRIAAENAIFSMPELNHGWVPGWGGLSRLRRLIGEAKAKEMILLGDRYNADQAYSFGLISKVYPGDRLNVEVNSIAGQLAKIDPFVVEMSKNALMNHHKSTWGSDLLFDALATYYSKL